MKDYKSLIKKLLEGMWRLQTSAEMAKEKNEQAAQSEKERVAHRAVAPVATPATRPETETETLTQKSTREAAEQAAQSAKERSAHGIVAPVATPATPLETATQKSNREAAEQAAQSAKEFESSNAYSDGEESSGEEVVSTSARVANVNSVSAQQSQVNAEGDSQDQLSHVEVVNPIRDDGTRAPTEADMNKARKNQAAIQTDGNFLENEYNNRRKGAVRLGNVDIKQSQSQGDQRQKQRVTVRSANEEFVVGFHPRSLPPMLRANYAREGYRKDDYKKYIQKWLHENITPAPGYNV